MNKLMKVLNNKTKKKTLAFANGRWSKRRRKVFSCKQFLRKEVGIEIFLGMTFL